MYYTTISGSLRKFLKDISDYYLEFESHGVKVLSPQISKIKNPDDQFIYFEENGNKPIKYIEKNHLLNIAQSDFLFVVNPNGYIGNSTLLEIGYALAKNIKVFSSEVPQDILLKNLLTSNMTISEILNSLPDKSNQKILEKIQKLPELQEYMKKKVIERGFDKESEIEVMLLLLEELGEISRAIRLYSGLKVKKQGKKSDNWHKLEEELADVFIYLLILANKLGIDLYETFKSKELENDKRDWVVFQNNP